MSSSTAVVEVSDADIDGGPERPPGAALVLQTAHAPVLRPHALAIVTILTATGRLNIASI
jgi:hypothetical protein